MTQHEVKQYFQTGTDPVYSIYIDRKPVSKTCDKTLVKLVPVKGVIEVMLRSD